MDTLNTLTAFEVHQIAYLTMHGWEVDMGGKTWTKPGFTRTTLGNPDHCRCGRCQGKVETKEFDLDDAYWAQQEFPEKVVEEVMGS